MQQHADHEICVRSLVNSGARSPNECPVEVSSLDHDLSAVCGVEIRFVELID